MSTSPAGNRRLQPPLTVLYDADCGFCTRVAMLLCRLDRARHLRLVPLQLAHAQRPAVAWLAVERDLAASIHVIDETGRWRTGGEATVAIAEAIPSLAWLARLARLPMVTPFVEPLYRLVARERGRLSGVVGAVACRLPGRKP